MLSKASKLFWRRSSYQRKPVLIFCSLVLIFYFIYSTSKLPKGASSGQLRQRFRVGSHDEKDDLFNQASGWVRHHIISAKKWWYKTIVLRDDDVQGRVEFEDFPDKKSISDKKLKQVMKEDNGLDDFDYDYPEQDTFAYIWISSSQAQFCSALIGLRRMKQLRSGLRRKADYVLVFLGDGSPKDEENLYLDNPVAEQMVEKWIAEGGILGGFNLNITDPTRKSNGRTVRALKLATLAFGYTWIILVEPDTIPLKHLDDLFDLYNRSSTFGPIPGTSNIIGPRAHPELIAPPIQSYVDEAVHCFGKRSQPISTALFVFQPTRTVELRIKRMNRIADKKGNSFARLKSKNLAPKLKKLEKKYPDVILINEEFACNDEIFLLPRDVARLDAEFLGEMPVSLESTYLVKFSLSKKPWEAAFKQKYLPNFSSEFRKMIKVWLKEAENVCGFSDPDDWIEKTEQDQDTNDLYFYENHQIGPPHVQFQEGFEFSPEPVAPIVFPDLHVGDVPMQQQIGLNNYQDPAPVKILRSPNFNYPDRIFQHSRPDNLLRDFYPPEIVRKAANKNTGNRDRKPRPRKSDKRRPKKKKQKKGGKQNKGRRGFY